MPLKMNGVYYGYDSERIADWKAGELGDRRWPQWGGTKEDPRPVKIKITSFVGIAAFAKHAYLEVEEETNHIWNSRHDCWACYKHWSEGEGVHGKFSLANEDQAWALASQMIKVCGFYKPVYNIKWDTPHDLRKKRDTLIKRLRGGD